jgi:uncharacterized protein (DUF58 family)
VLTSRGRKTIVLFLVLLVVGRILGVTELFGIAAVAGALVILAVIQARPASVRVAVSGRITPEAIQAGDPAVLELFVENADATPTPSSRLQLVPSGGGRHRVLVPRLAPEERATVTVGLDTRARGRKTVAGYEALLVDSLGLACRSISSTGSFSCLVRPRIEELPQTLPIGAGGLGLESTQSAAERLRSGASLLRNYVEGDDLRLVHWRTTARVGDLMVREGGEPDLSGRSGATVALVTHGSPGPRFERAVEVAASVLNAAFEEGPFRLVTTSGYDSGMGSGSWHLETAIVNLATVEAVPAAPSPASGPGRRGPGTSLMERLAPRFSGPDDWNVLVVVEALGTEDETAARRDELHGLPQRSGVVTLMLVGGSELRFERLSHDHVIVVVPEDRPLADVWTASVDVPVGETRLVQPA